MSEPKAPAYGPRSSKPSTTPAMTDRRAAPGALAAFQRPERVLTCIGSLSVAQAATSRASLRSETFAVRATAAAVTGRPRSSSARAAQAQRTNASA